MNLTIPVSPYVGTLNGITDVVFSLLDVAPPDKIRFSQPNDVALKYQHATMSSGQLSVQALADLGINTGISVSNHFTGNIVCFAVDLTAYADVPNTVKDSIIRSARFSVGFRIGVVAFSIKNEAKTSTPGLLAASATLNLASSLYQVTVLGAGVEALDILKPILIASTGEFSVETIATLGAAEDELQNYVNDHMTELTPSLDSVTIETEDLIKILYPKGTGDYEKNALAQTYAFERAYAVKSCDEALADSRVEQYNLNKEIIIDVYTNILQMKNQSEKPTSAAQQIAKDVLHAGRW